MNQFSTLFLIFIIAISNSFVIAKYSHPLFGLAGSVIILIFMIYIYKYSEKKYISYLVSNKYIVLTFFIFIFMVIFFIYPIADGLKYSGGGTDRDDALIQSFNLLTNSENPYTKMTYLNMPISPGAGWIILLSPFLLLGIYGYAILILLLLFLIRVVRIFNLSIYEINSFAVILGSNILFWYSIAVGDDFFIFGLLLLWLMIELFHLESKKFLNLVFLSLLFGLLLTARLPFFPIVGIIFILLYFKNKAYAFIFGFISFFTIVLTHYIFYYWSIQIGVEYHPLHLINRVSGDKSLVSLFPSLLAGIFILYYIFKNYRQISIIECIVAVSLSIFAIVLPGIISSSIVNNFNLSKIDALNYFEILLAPTVFLVILSMKYKKNV